MTATRTDDPTPMDFPAFVISLLSGDWLFFAEGDIVWDGQHHIIRGVQANASKLPRLMDYVDSCMDGFENAREVARYLVAALGSLENDEGLRCPHASVAPGVRRAIREGDLTGITLANLAACGSALVVSVTGDDAYRVIYDSRLARGIPRFFDLRARLLWNLRLCSRSEAGVPFEVVFAAARDFDADEYLGVVEHPVPGAQRNPGTMAVASLPEIHIPRAEDTGSDATFSYETDDPLGLADDGAPAGTS